MAQQWFYAEGETSVGPLSPDALADALRRMAEPGKTLVWHTGLETWRRAGDIPELAGRIAKPPTDVASPDPALDRWTGPEQLAGEPAAAGSRRRGSHLAAALVLAVAIIGGATYASRVSRSPDDRGVSVPLPPEAARPQLPAEPDRAELVAALSARAAQAAAATDTIALKLWASIEPETMRLPPNFATASRSDLEGYLRDLKTAEANVAAVRQQYAALLDAERGLIEEAARASGLDEDGRNELLDAVGDRHRASRDRVERMLQARESLYRALQAAQVIAIGEFGKYKVDAAGHVRFSSKAVTDRAIAATERINAANEALDRVELEMTRTQQTARQAAEPAWKGMIREWTGAP